MDLERTASKGIGAVFGAVVWLITLCTLGINSIVVIAGILLALARPVFWIPVILTVPASALHLVALGKVRELNRLEFAQAGEPSSVGTSWEENRGAVSGSEAPTRHEELQAGVGRSARSAAIAGFVSMLAGLVIALRTNSNSDDTFKMFAWGWTFVIFAAEMTWLKLFWDRAFRSVDPTRAHSRI